VRDRNTCRIEALANRCNTNAAVAAPKNEDVSPVVLIALENTSHGGIAKAATQIPGKVHLLVVVRFI
jgi:hypothetical protein